KCFKNDTVTVRTVPYPIPFVIGQDPICYGNNAQLTASGGSTYLWSPPAYLNNINIANPLAVFPKQSLTYTVSVRDTFGCPKPVLKDFRVNVVRLIADAGPQDTSVVLGQPLQLNGSGGNIFSWSPVTFLDNPNIRSPLSLPQNDIKYTLTVSNNIGCAATDTIKIKVFFLPPDLYVPSAFTPTGDKNNDLFRPIALGIKSLESFSVYNRWGVLLYKTSRIGDGWDGKYKGVNQDSGTFVWQANATDYKSLKIFRKGTVILIR
ncbi:MAG: gliding motility-associated C-terminal domain-containing protein, partial [Ferruginibacter sp.]|nr:gliding motility-associated C-terminal domain-containing protein [Ferruginibacter sp.]